MALIGVLVLRSPQLSQPSSFHARSCSLADYGWDEACEHAFVPHRAAGLIPARIVRAERGSCEAVTDVGILHAEVPGAADQGPLLSAPCPGGWAALRSATTDRGSVLHAVFERRTVLVRSTASRIVARLRAGREAMKKDITQYLRATYRFRERQL